MKNAVLWDVTPCGFIINLHLHGRRSNTSEEVLDGYLQSCTLKMKRRFLQDLHGVTSQKKAFFSLVKAFIIWASVI
jgi:hypothetical protein